MDLTASDPLDRGGEEKVPEDLRRKCRREVRVFQRPSDGVVEIIVSGVAVLYSTYLTEFVLLYNLINTLYRIVCKFF